MATDEGKKIIYTAHELEYIKARALVGTGNNETDVMLLGLLNTLDEFSNALKQADIVNRNTLATLKNVSVSINSLPIEYANQVWKHIPGG